ncbi:hypothetical protein BKA82DRAFT_23421 [Pisolithus tinctorius]|uniref:Uncharacterized protein n=1 Tax=Pisolithus tinctorius Marx 270 TaxID=870435 RepID=A0A0C3PGK7_PISTI|nr:hypothetical protein BKA82DRAFT_23421 [Pisolithus tinctorius]KIO07516.1 hypothetical protein M404DRAFT_23421 [Pisolithus tinctorius Marx 270]
MSKSDTAKKATVATQNLFQQHSKMPPKDEITKVLKEYGKLHSMRVKFGAATKLMQMGLWRTEIKRGDRLKLYNGTLFAEKEALQWKAAELDIAPMKRLSLTPVENGGTMTPEAKSNAMDVYDSPPTRLITTVSARRQVTAESPTLKKFKGDSSKVRPLMVDLDEESDDVISNWSPSPPKFSIEEIDMDVEEVSMASSSKRKMNNAGLSAGASDDTNTRPMQRIKVAEGTDERGQSHQ